MMEQEYSTIKILLEKGHKSFKIKKFPLYIGSEKAPGVFRLPGDGVDPRHGVLFIEKNNLVYEDLSTAGTKIGGIKRNKEKIRLTHGNNQLNIGRYRIIINNRYALDKSIELKNRKSKRLYKILGSIITLLIVILSAFFVYINYIKPPVDVVVNDFIITPDPINYFDDTIFKNVSLESASELDLSKIGGTLLIQKKYGAADSITFSNLRFFQGSKIKLPTGLIEESRNDDTVYFSLQLEGEHYNFLPRQLKKPVIISNRKQQQSNESITLTTNITGYLLEYKIDDSLNIILNYEIFLGDGRKFGPEKILQSAISYYKEGEYDFVLRSKLKNGRTLEFQRKIIVD